MPEIIVRDARSHDCGRMARMLRGEHMEGLARVGLDTHRTLRTICDRSFYRKAFLVDGDLMAIGGCEGSFLDPIGYMWLAVSRRAHRYPKALVACLRQCLEEILLAKHELIATVIDGDEDAVRLMAFLGFAPIDLDNRRGMPVHSARGRHRFVRSVLDGVHLRRPLGNTTMVAFSYRAEAHHVVGL